MKRVQDLFDIPTTDPDEALRSRLLNVMVIVIFIGMSVALVIDLLSSQEVFPMVLVSQITLLAVYGLNRLGYADVASLVFTIFLLIVTAAFRLIDDGSSILFIIPIVVATVLLRFWAGVVVAGLSATLMLFPAPGNGFPAGPTSIVFFTVAVILGVFAYGFEKSRKELITLNEDLEGSVAARTEELRRAQEELLVKERLATLGQLSGGIGHELRSPLGSILNAVEYLKICLENPDTKIAESLGIIESEVEKSVRTIESLLGFAKSRTPIKDKIDPESLIRDIISQAKIPSNIELITELEPGLHEIMVDTFQIKQAFTNVIMNAIEAMREGGTLTVSSRNSDNEYVSIVISDTGSGISKEHMDMLFKPLFTTKPTGVGLGLTITRMMIEANGGKIEVNSEPDVGTSFIFLLPRK